VAEPLRDPNLDVTALLDVVDTIAGAALAVVAAAGAARRALEPAILPDRLRPGRLAAAVLRPAHERGRVWRERFTDATLRWLDTALPAGADAALDRVDATELVRRHVDLDRVVADVDVDAIAGRLDTGAVIARVDLDEVARRLDVLAILDRLDLTDVVLSRVDLDAIAGRLDLDAVVGRVDFDAILERLDLTAVVLGRVDLRAVVTAALAEIDLPALVEEVLDEIDLPEIVRESTGTMTSDAVRNVRLQGVNADEAVSRFVDRFRLRRGTPAPEGSG
jgi:hypothetical protein